ncbi:DnaJ C-terminal domain-containing protein [Zavarzinella formosa]|uniref:DnaJ C-terminal domain-containing protein n=1 Tax=Zavarzinella formosa TaxID=360055 RepID=UPI0002EB5E26|nr:DnaJ C-terminal domain-containing protein [Zavarzinella formosa]
MAKDYYAVLGLGKSATPEEISKAYKKLARENHPDRNPGDKAAETRFKEIQNAYDVLNDPKKKATYDQFGSEMPNMGGGPGGFNFGGGGGGMPQVDPEMAQEIFKRFFGGGGGGGAEDLFGGPRGGRGRPTGRSRQPQAETIDVEARVPFLTAAIGGTIGLRVGDRELDVKVPAGFEDGKKLRLAGQGEYGEDIVVKVMIEPHAYFRREGKDVLLDVPVSIPEAVLGGKVSVPTVEGKRVEVKIPPGSSSGGKIRLTGMGIAGGNQYLVIKIMLPKGKPDDEAKRLIEEYAKANGFDARADVAWK